MRGNARNNNSSRQHQVVVQSKGKNTFNIITAKTAFAKANITWKLVYEEVDYIDLIHKSVPSMKHHLEVYREKWRAVKCNMSLHAIFEKAADPSVVSDPPAVFVSEQMELYEDIDIDELLKLTVDQLVNRIES